MRQLLQLYEISLMLKTKWRTDCHLTGAHKAYMNIGWIKFLLPLSSFPSIQKSGPDSREYSCGVH